MRKGILIAVCFLLYNLHSSAQEYFDTSFAKTVFWKVCSADKTQSFFIYGTAHPIFREDLNIPDSVLSAILHSSVVYFENIPSPADDSLKPLIVFMDKPKLKRVIGKIGYENLVHVLKQTIPEILEHPRFEYMRPQYINSQLIKFTFGSNLTTVDEVLVDFALKNNKQVYALDELDIRLKLNELISLDNQATALFKMTQDLEGSQKAFRNYTKAMTSKYYEGDIGFLYTKMNYVLVNDRSYGGSHLYRKEGMEELLDKRNKQWIKKIREAANTPGAFFAFGAGHLPGKNGILRLLQLNGYSLTPLFIERD